MKNINKDKRARRTCMLIKQALIRILHSKSISAVSVTEICREADVTRSSFYRYYTVPEDVLAEIEDELLEKAKEHISFGDRSHKNVLTNIFEFIKTNEDINFLLLINQIDSKFIEKVVSAYYERNINSWQSIKKSSSVDMAENFFIFSTAGSLALIRNWIIGGFKETPEELAEIIEKIVTHGKNGF